MDSKKKPFIFLCIALVVIVLLVSVCKNRKYPPELAIYVVAFVVLGVIETVDFYAQNIYFFFHSMFNNTPQFTRHSIDITNHKILVRKVPKNNLDISKMIIAYFDSTGFPKTEFNVETADYYMMKFYKLNHTTSNGGYEAKYDLGGIYKMRCKNDSTKWKIRFSLSIGIKQMEDGPWPITEDTMLLDECG